MQYATAEKEIGMVGDDYMIRVRVRDEKGDLVRECLLIVYVKEPEPKKVRVKCRDKDSEYRDYGVIDLSSLSDDKIREFHYSLATMTGEEILEKVLTSAVVGASVMTKI